MALLYRGAGPGSYWHTNDARTLGFAPHSPGGTPSNDRILNHIARASTTSPYISFTRSFGVARAYGLFGSAGIASVGRPGFVYEIEITDDKLCKPIDPMIEVARHLPDPWKDPNYHHDGSQAFILGVIDPIRMRNYLQEQCLFPPGSGGTARSPNLSREVECLVRALRDAEVLVLGNVPASIVRNRYDIS